MEILIAIGASGYIIYFATVYLEKRKKYKDEVASVRDEYEEWASKEEPRYRNMHTYPPDWHFRKLYVQKRDKYKCNICGYRMVFNDRELKKTIETRRHTMRTGLHVHHKKSLSSGGDNSLGNLICLCESCHENQHPNIGTKPQEQESHPVLHIGMLKSPR